MSARALVVLAGLILAGSVAGILLVFSKDRPRPSSGRLELCASFFPLHEWAQAVAGPDADVYLLEGEAGDPHGFSPSMSDGLRIGRARALIVVGLGLDPWSHRAVESAGAQDSQGRTELWEVGTWVERRRFNQTEVSGAGREKEHAGEGEHGHAHEAGSEDPHVWLDPARAAQIVLRMAEEFARLDPSHAQGYGERAAACARELQAFSEEIPELARPIAGRQIVTLHDAYGYLLERCGVRLAGVVQLSPEIEPSAGELVAAVRAMKAIGQKVVFTEPGAAGAARALAAELGGQVEYLDPLESAASPCGKTYLERLRHDVRTLVENLR